MRKEDGRIGVLMGGSSAEREVSFRSGKAVLNALLERGHKAAAVELGTPTIEQLRVLDIDAAFIALHGTFGEDGRIQAMLEEVDIPYTGSNVNASRLGMDKVASKKLFRENGLYVPDYEVLTDKTLPRLRFGRPFVVKPSAQGSSVGVSIVEEIEDLKEAVIKAFDFGDAVLIEEFIPGKEVTVGILDERPLPVIQVVPKRKFYDRVAKYTTGMTEYLVPAPISEKEAAKIQAAAVLAHKSLDCRSFSRVDMILGADGRVAVLEVNTIPGMTQLSLLPKAAAAAGIDFPQLCEKMLESAYEKMALKG